MCIRDRPDTVAVEPPGRQPGQQPEHENVDEDQYQTKGDEQEAKHDELQDGPDKCVEQAEEESGSEQSQNHSLGLKVNSRQQQRHQTQGHAIGNDLDEHETPVELEFSNIGHGSIMDWAGGGLYHRNGVNMV